MRVPSLLALLLTLIAPAVAGCSGPPGCGGGVEIPAFEMAVRTPGASLRAVPNVQPSGWGVATYQTQRAMVPIQEATAACAPAYGACAPAAPPLGYTSGYGWAAPPPMPGAPAAGDCR